MIISPTHNFIFFKPLKCAGSSVEYSLRHACGPDDLLSGGTEEERVIGYTHQHNEYVQGGKEFIKYHSHTWPEVLFERSAHEPNRWDEFYKMSVVRNPWDACVSWYWWIISNHPEENRWLAHEAEDDRAAVQSKFEQFLIAPFVPQSFYPGGADLECTMLTYLAYANQNFVHPCIDAYLRFETLDHDYAQLCKKLSMLHSPLQQLKSKHREIRVHYSYYYTPAAREFVQRAFPKIVDQFGYEFEDRYQEDIP
jgi:hypothetical protein